MNRNLVLTLLAGIGATSLLVGCSSKPSPKLGEKTTVTQAAEGVTIVGTDKRALLDSGKLAGEDSTLVTVDATVEAVNPRTRVISLRTPDGKTTDIIAGEEVRNFAQIKRGDTVKVDLYLSVAFETRKPTTEEIAMAGKEVAAAGRAPLGSKPGMFAAVGETKIATIESIDKEKELVVLKDSTGIYTTVKAKYPENLAYISTGDTLEFGLF